MEEQKTKATERRDAMIAIHERLPVEITGNVKKLYNWWTILRPAYGNSSCLAMLDQGRSAVVFQLAKTESRRGDMTKREEASYFLSQTIFGLARAKDVVEFRSFAWELEENLNTLIDEIVDEAVAEATAPKGGI